MLLPAAPKLSQPEKEEEGKKKRTAFLDLLLDLKDAGQLSLSDVTEETDTFMFEGHDTTAHGIIWALYSLGRNPHCQTRAREEIQAVLGTQLRRTVLLPTRSELTTVAASHTTFGGPGPPPKSKRQKFHKGGPL